MKNNREATMQNYFCLKTCCVIADFTVSQITSCLRKVAHSITQTNIHIGNVSVHLDVTTLLLSTEPQVRIYNQELGSQVLKVLKLDQFLFPFHSL